MPDVVPTSGARSNLSAMLVLVRQRQLVLQSRERQGIQRTAGRSPPVAGELAPLPGSTGADGPVQEGHPEAGQLSGRLRLVTHRLRPE